MTIDPYFLHKTLELAQLGESLSYPNPSVGAVIIDKDGVLIGSGFHRKYGEAHAEVNAINDALAKGFNKFNNCTIYVSLEPCAHHGKTPPCSDLIIHHGFKKLVYFSSDPNPQVSGKGIQAIRDAGIEVIGPQELINSGFQDLVKKAQYLNRAFFKKITQDKPWLTVKIALTPDGRMITRTDEPRWITDDKSRQDVHRMRSTHELIVTGFGTVIADDPLLTVRHSAEDLKLADIKNPQRVILKRNRDFSEEQRSSLKIFQDGSKTFEYKIGRESCCFKDLEDFISTMYKKGYGRIMIEAGPTLSKAFTDAGLNDELIIFQA